MENIGRFESIGEAWIGMLKHIEDSGVNRKYTDNTGESFDVRECFGLTMSVAHPYLPDPIIEKYKVQEEYDWMVDNFTSFERVKELSNASSYASRLYAYQDQKNQLEWVIRRLKDNPEQRSATITTFEPLTDEKYIPCVSLLDFQKNLEDGSLDLYVYSRALDFGCKAYVNMVMLAKILDNVSKECGYPVGKLEMVIKSAHYYTKDTDKVRRIMEQR